MYRCTKLCTVYVDNTGKPVITGLSIWISMKLEFSCSLYVSIILQFILYFQKVTIQAYQSIITYLNMAFFNYINFLPHTLTHAYTTYLPTHPQFKSNKFKNKRDSRKLYNIFLVKFVNKTWKLDGQVVIHANKNAITETRIYFLRA